MTYNKLAKIAKPQTSINELTTFLDEGDPKLDKALKSRVITILVRARETLEKELLSIIETYVTRNFDGQAATEIMKTLKSGTIDDWIEHMSNDPKFMNRVENTLF